MLSKLVFDYQKATQALNFFARKYQGHNINKMMVLKLIWAADRYHLRKYGRPVIGDEYVAMNYGPVASGVKDIAEGDGFLPEIEKDYAAEYINLSDQYTVKSVKDVDLDVFSDSDLEAMDFAFKEFGSNYKYKMVEVTHQYPEWKKFSLLFKTNQISRAPMDYFDFFSDPDTSSKDKFALDKEVLNESRERFIEYMQTQAIL